MEGQGRLLYDAVHNGLSLSLAETSSPTNHEPYRVRAVWNLLDS